MVRAGQRKGALQPAKLPGGMESTAAAPSPIYVEMQSSCLDPPAQTSSSPRAQAREVSATVMGSLFFPFTPTKELRALLIQHSVGNQQTHDVACAPSYSPPSATMRQLYDHLLRAHQSYFAGDGALRSGGAVSLWSRSYIGVAISSVFAGFMLGALPSTIVSARVQVRVATVAPLLGPAFSPFFGLSSPVMLLPASLRFFFGLASDIFPIYGSHRKPYMLIGWIVSFFAFLLGGILLSASALQEPSLLLLLVACSGVTLADVAGDGLVVELAQREPVATRGRTLAIATALKLVGVALSQVYIGVLQGSLLSQWAPTDPNYLGFVYSLAMLSVVPTPFVYHIAASRPASPSSMPSSTAPYPSSSVLDRVMGLWSSLQSKAIASFLLFSALFSLTIHVGSGGTSAFKREVVDVWIERNWLHRDDTTVAPRQSLLMLGAGALVAGLAIVGVTKLRWKAALAWSTLVIGVVGSLHASYTVFGTSRAPWFWYATLLVLQIPHGIRHIMSLLPVVELAPVGLEATMAALATSVQLAAIPIATAVFSLAQDKLIQVLEPDTASIAPSLQAQVGDLMALGPLAGFGVFVSLFWLPNSAVEAQVWRLGGGRSRAVGWSVVALWWGGLTFLLVTSTLALYSGWSCGVVLGGLGCTRSL